MDSNNDNWLEIAIRTLKGKGIIKTVKQVADATGYTEGAISNMTNGKVGIGVKFTRKFNNLYGEHLLSSQTGEPEVKYIATPPTLDYDELAPIAQQYIFMLEERDRAKDEQIRLLKGKLTSQDKVIDLLESKIEYLESKIA